MNLLVYYVSFNGKHFYDKTRKSLETLIKKGGYDGDIIILTDAGGVNEFKIDEINKINPIDCGDVIKKQIEFISGEHNVRYYRNIKSYIVNIVDIYDYDAILYLDSDVLVNNDIYNIFEMSINGNKIITQKDVGNVDKTKMINGRIEGPTLGSDVLNREQIEYLHGNGFCTGVVCFPKSHFVILEKWHEKNVVERMKKSDQGNFHWTIANYQYLENIKCIKAYPFGNKKDDELNKMVFLHYWTGENIKFDNMYKKIMNKMNLLEDYKAFVITLEGEEDRLLECSKELKSKNIVYEVFKAKFFDKSQITTDLSPRQFGCRNSHLTIMGRNLNLNKNLLIIEDDIYFHPDYDELIVKCNESFSKINKWDIIYFYNSLKNKFKFGEEMFTEGKTDGAFFYLINKRSINKVFDIISKINNKPIDWSFRQAIYEGKIKAFVCKNDVVRAKLKNGQKENYV